MNERSQTLLIEMLKDSTTELLDYYRVSGTLTDRQHHDIELVATLGFGSDDVSGAIALGTTQKCAVYLAHSTSAKHEHDWLGELGNQLLGRIKRRLTAYGVPFSLGVPVLIKGTHIELALAMDLSRSTRLAYSTPAGVLEIWLELRAQSGVELTETPDEQASVSEGEVLLF